MDCCFPIGDCEAYSVTPVFVATRGMPKLCEDPPMCCPRLPSCPKPVMYCCETKPTKTVYCCEKKPPCCEENRAPPSKPKPPCCEEAPPSRPVKTKYIIPCYRYEDGRIVRKLPVTAFKRNGMQDQEHSKMLGTTNFLVRCPQDVSVVCDVSLDNIKVGDPAKVPPLCTKPALPCVFMKKKPIEKNQTTVLMRRACEVACGARARRKPFVVSSYQADPDHEIRRYHSEDAKGNCCIHFERNHSNVCAPCAPRYPIGPCVSSPGCEYTDYVAAEPCATPSCCYYCGPVPR